MKLSWTNPPWRIIDFQHFLTPIAVERICLDGGIGVVKVRLIYIFGIRVAYFNATPFKSG
jgi:hypothetical protein